MSEKRRDKLRKILLYGGVDREEYEDAQQELNRNNRSAFFFVGTTCMILFLGMYVSTFIPTKTESLSDLRIRSRYFYFGCMLFCVLIMVIAKWILAKRKTMVLLFLYLLLSVLYGFGIWGGTFNQPYYPSVTFFVFLVGLPLSIIDRPVRLYLYLACICVIFFFCSFLCKEKEVFQLDVLNGICFSYLSLSVGLSIQRVRITGIVQKKIVEVQRDQDQLSGLLNKAALERDICKAMEQSKTGALLMMDLDDFKNINDTYGHIYGDAAIRAVGNCIDTVFSSDAVTGRFGGDEFVVYLKEVSEKKQILEKIQNLQSMVKENLQLPSRSDSITVSIGVGFWKGEATTYVTLLENADRALYKAKRAGKNQYHFSL